MRARFALTIALSLVVGCDGGVRDADGGMTCTTDLDCDDGLECTIDSCGVGNSCRWDPIDERCDTGQTCQVGIGCSAGTTCTTDADCDDSIMCTLDACGVGGICNNRTLDERCTAPEVCDATMGCTAPSGCASDAECDDEIACTNDSCGADRTCRNTPLNELCDSGAGEMCSATEGCVVPMDCTSDAECQDDSFCNGAEVCDPEFGCQPAEAARVCDDSDDCTDDSCDDDAGRCIFACDPTRTECGCTPDITCDGAFNLPGANGNCLGGLISWDFTNVRFTNEDGVITVTGWSVSSTGAFPPMADTGPACPNVDASTSLGGSCAETYRIQGTFTDHDTFTGTFTAMFTGGGCLTCTTTTVPITGTRTGA